jgi:hypothetical protein
VGLDIGDLVVDLVTGRGRSPRGEVSFTPNELKVLSLLAAHRGETVERDALFEVLGYRPSVVSRAVDQTIWRLRRKIEANPEAPSHLLSSPNAGYRLAPQQLPASPALVGRGVELELARSLVAQHGQAWVAGLPGSGRRALSAATGVADRLTVVDLPPDGVPLVKVGPLPSDVACGWFAEQVTLARGEPLAAAELAEVPGVVERADRLPGPLRELAAQAVVRSVGPELVPPTPDLSAALASVPLLATVSGGSVFPDPFDATEARQMGIAPEALALATRAGWVTRDGGRLRLLRAVRRALPASPDQVARYHELIVARLDPAADRYLRTRTDSAAAELVALRARYDALPAGVASWRVVTAYVSSNARVPPLPPNSDDPHVDVLRTFDATRRRRVSEAERLALATFDGSLDAGTRAAALLTAADGAGEALPELAAALAELARFEPTPYLRAAAALVGALAVRATLPAAEFREGLLGALALAREGGSGFLVRWCARLLSTQAAHEGRASEAIEWLRTVDPKPSLRRAFLKLFAADLVGAEEDLDVLVPTERVTWADLEVGRAWLEVLTGRSATAVVRLRALRRDEVRHVWGRRVLLAVAQTVMGHLAAALEALDEPAGASTPPEVLVAVRAWVLGANGDAAGARHLLARGWPEVPPGWAVQAEGVLDDILTGGRSPPGPWQHGALQLGELVRRAAVERSR